MSSLEACFRASEVEWAGYQEKPAGLIISETYRKPTQVGRRKCAKVNKWKILKELGKQVIVT